MHERNALKTESDKEKLISAGRILYLTKNPDLIQKQLNGERLINIDHDQLLDNISTDAIIPNKACITWDGKTKGHLANNLLTGLPGAVIKQGDITGKFETVVAGKSFARGSSRIHAPLAFKDAGINLIIAKGERIFAENCANLGIFLVDSDSDEANQLVNGASIESSGLLSLMPFQSAEIIKNGGLLRYLKSIEQKNNNLSEIKTKERPMTIAEKIIALKTLNPMRSKAVKPGDEVIATPDIYYGYELQTNATIKALEEEFKNNVRIKHPLKAFFYSDHTALLKDENTKVLRQQQSEFGKPLGITVYEADPIKGAPAICHTDMLENHALPGQLILGNDSHTCTVGALNNLAIGKGAIDLAGALAYDKMIIKVPETIRINLEGQLAKGVTLKDFMLQFGSMPELKNQTIGSGRVFEFGGNALNFINFDQQIKLANMSIELLGFTGIIEPNLQMIKFLKQNRGLSESEINNQLVTSDKNAEYFHTFNIDLNSIEPTVSEPGDTQNGKPLSEIRDQHIKIQKVYIGSCTHGTVDDLQQAAEILRGRKINKNLKLFAQASSLNNLNEAERLGIINDLKTAGAEILPIGCGACMNAGPGSTEEGEIGLFATNRNFPGRTGKGKTYLSSPIVAAASAINGYISGPEDIN